jgi:sec-independent protein translocase protein TatC
MASPGDPERPFLEHLDELRRRLRSSLLMVVAGMIVAGLAFRPLAGLVRGQLKAAYLAVGHPADFQDSLLSLSPTDTVGLVFKFALAGGIFLALPLLLVQLWGFASPALRGQERRVAGWLVAAGPLFFVGGFLFSFFKVMPLSAECLLRISYYYGFVPRWTAESYFSFFLVLNLAFGACFELPLVMVILSVLGLAGPAVFARYRRHWVVASFVIGGFLPPPEVVSMAVQAVALIALYEVGIAMSRLLVTRKPSPQSQGQG